jgi:peptidyl-prolyl cis-trans isomerase B (cyclophilin B)
VSPNRRDREYARRRHEEWLAKQEAARQQRVERLRRLNIIAAVAAVLVVVGAVAFLSTRGDDGGVAVEPGSDPPVSVTEEPTGGGTGGTTGSETEPAADNPCPEPSTGAREDAPSFEAAPDPSLAAGQTVVATLQTSCGEITLELDGEAAPQAVSSFQFLSQEGFYDNTPCHRLTDQNIFVLQCGDPTGTGQGGPGYTYGPAENAPADDLYPAGTVAMARVGDDAQSMGSQFFLVYEDSTIPSDTAGGYTVLGTITEGLDVLAQIADGGAAPADAGGNTAPVRAVSIESVEIG